jgi:hypothetical protein
MMMETTMTVSNSAPAVTRLGAAVRQFRHHDVSPFFRPFKMFDPHIVCGYERIKMRNLARYHKRLAKLRTQMGAAVAPTREHRAHMTVIGERTSFRRTCA